MSELHRSILRVIVLVLAICLTAFVLVPQQTTLSTTQMLVGTVVVGLMVAWVLAEPWLTRRRG